VGVRITSLVSSGPLWIALTSGEQLRLAPGQTSEERPDVDVQDNSAVDSLVERGMIEVAQVGDEPRRAGGKKAEQKHESAGATAEQRAEAGEQPSPQS
jgi:hypothetical protein